MRLGDALLTEALLDGVDSSVKTLLVYFLAKERDGAG